VYMYKKSEPNIVNVMMKQENDVSW
jgi:hypothetical protein